MSTTKETWDLKYRPKTWDELLGNETAAKQMQGEPVRSYILHGPSGTGKAQPLYSKILTPEGFITMGEVKVGDVVITDSGAHAQIVGVYPQGERDIYEITLQDRTKIRVSDNHLNKVHVANQFSLNGIKRTEKVYKVLETTELIEFMSTYKGRVRIDTPTVEFNYKDVPIDPYLLGALIGDGGLHNAMRFSNAERDVLAMVENVIKRDYGMRLAHSENHDYRISYIDVPNHAGNRGDRGRHPISRNYNLDSTLRGKIMGLGLNCLSRDKFIPDEYLYNTREVRLGILQGLMDTDGTTGVDGSTEFSTSSKQLSDDFSILARSLGIRVTESTKISTINGKEYGLHYRLHLHIPNNIEYFRSEKHRSRRTKRQHPQLRNIVSIEYVGREECQCIMVGHKDHTYISDDFIPTHNTTSIRIMAKEINAEVIEFDAASLGKDDIETIKKTAQHTSMFNPYKLIILDEAHTLSNQAKDALLKAIEEGNKGTVWAMCTTELHKMAPAIQTRSRIIELKRTNKEDMVDHLNFITKEEGFDLDKYQDQITEIVFFADGKVRQAVKLLETLLKTGNLDLPFTQKDAIEVLRATYANDIQVIQSKVSGYTNDDIFVLIKLISEFMTAFSLHNPTKKEEPMEVLLRKYTTISPALVGELRAMTSAIGSTIHTPAHMGKEKIINRLYSLLETLMKNYNNFDDNRYNIKASLIWYASQLDVWRQEDR